MNFKPLYDRILVEPLEQEEKTAGGIIIPDTAKDKPTEGMVISVGDGRKDCGSDGKYNPCEGKLAVKVGDRVLFGKWAGTEIKMDGKSYLVIKESDVLGIFN